MRLHKLAQSIRECREVRSISPAGRPRAKRLDLRGARDLFWRIV